MTPIESAYIVTTESGHEWLIEDATSAQDALRQYYDGGAEAHIALAATEDIDKMDYLREMGQAT